MSIEDSDNKIFSAMQTGEPVAVYRKTTLGKAYVEVLSSFTGEIEGLILFGDPKGDEAFVELWSDKEEMFFKRRNKKLLETGVVIKDVKPALPEPERTIEQYTDDELRDVISFPFLKLVKVIGTVTSDIVLERMIALATSMEKSEKILNIFRARLSEIQGNSVSNE